MCLVEGIFKADSSRMGKSAQIALHTAFVAPSANPQGSHTSQGKKALMTEMKLRLIHFLLELLSLVQGAGFGNAISILNFLPH